MESRRAFAEKRKPNFKGWNRSRRSPPPSPTRGARVRDISGAAGQVMRKSAAGHSDSAVLLNACQCPCANRDLLRPFAGRRKMMKIGVSARISSRSMDITAVAQKAESLGFESLWLPEHSVMPVHVTTRYTGSPDGSIPASMSDMGDPFIGLARACRRHQDPQAWARGSAWSQSTTPCCWPKRLPPWTTCSGADFCSALAPGGCEKRRRSWGAISRIAGAKPGKRCSS